MSLLDKYVKLSPPPHKVTSCGFEVHVRWRQNACEVTFGGVYVELSPPPHKVTSCKCKVYVRWMRGACEVTLGVCMSSCPLHHTKSPRIDARCLQGGHEVTLRYVCQVVPSTIQSHLMWMRGAHEVDARYTRGRCEVDAR